MALLNATDLSHDPARALRLALISNAVFSTLSGLVLLAAPSMIAALIGLTMIWPVWSIGAGLVAYAASLALTARQTVIPRSAAYAAVLADLMWVGGSVLALAALGPAIPAPGEWMIALIALVVLHFAAWQYWGVRKLV